MIFFAYNQPDMQNCVPFLGAWGKGLRLGCLVGGDRMELGFPSAPTPSTGPLHAAVPAGDVHGCGEIV